MIISQGVPRVQHHVTYSIDIRANINQYQYTSACRYQDCLVQNPLGTMSKSYFVPQHEEYTAKIGSNNTRIDTQEHRQHENERATVYGSKGDD